MRIRTIKPEFFTHEGLFEAEKETKLPIRLAFAGLWCAADKEGRFKWEPRRLGVLILPYDSVDFSRVLDACLTRGLLVKYRVGDSWFGEVRSWKRHQFVNARETESSIPSSDLAEETYDACPTRAPRVEDASHKEGKGRERKDNGASGTRDIAEEIFQAYPRRTAKIDALKAISKALGTSPAERLLERTKAYAAAASQWPEADRVFIPHPATWFNRGSYDDDPQTWTRKGSAERHEPALTFV